MGIEEGKGVQIKGRDDLFSNTIAKQTNKTKNPKKTKLPQSGGREGYLCKGSIQNANRQDQKRNPPTHIIIKALNMRSKERILQAAKEVQQVTYKGKPIRITAGFLNSK
jgi:hypothetical protein